ncbi:hypothetical protein BH18ACT15_BH18ACT15_13040 [soil metagenome]
MAGSFEHHNPDTTTRLVRSYLRGRNLEQLGRADDAVPLYEAAVASAFDSTGPYDRLIHIYSSAARHSDVRRVCDAALLNIHTHGEKRAWYERMRAEADRAEHSVPRAAPRRRE